MLSRGNATSGAPICSGMIAFAQPAKAGVANSSSMIRPCMVNSWLYSFGVLNDLQAGREQLGADEHAPAGRRPGRRPSR